MVKIVGRYGGRPAPPEVAYIDEKAIAAYEPYVVPVIWAPEAPTPEAAVVTIDGKRGLFAFNNSGCPRSPAVVQHLKKKMERVGRLGYSVAILDELNYPTPHDGELFYSCFCQYCQAHSPRLKALKKGDIQGLAEARKDLVGDVLREVAQYAEGLGLRLEAAVHAPTIAHLAGQDYHTFLKHVDRLQVMLYHRCPGPACLNRELAMLARLGHNPYGIDPDAVEEAGVPIRALKQEAQKARELAGDRAVPILWADERLPEAIRAVEEAGFEEVIIFTP